MSESPDFSKSSSTWDNISEKNSWTASDFASICGDASIALESILGFMVSFILLVVAIDLDLECFFLV